MESLPLAWIQEGKTSLSTSSNPIHLAVCLGTPGWLAPRMCVGTFCQSEDRGGGMSKGASAFNWRRRCRLYHRQVYSRGAWQHKHKKIITQSRVGRSGNEHARQFHRTAPKWICLRCCTSTSKNKKRKSHWKWITWRVNRLIPDFYLVARSCRAPELANLQAHRELF